MSAAESLWTWLNVSVYLVGAVTTAYYAIHFVWLAYDGWKHKDDSELRASAERASQEQDERAVSIRKGVK